MSFVLHIITISTKSINFETINNSQEIYKKKKKKYFFKLKINNYLIGIKI